MMAGSLARGSRRLTMRWLLLSGAVLACGGSRSTVDSEAAPPVVGVFAIVAAIPGRHITGTLQVEADSITFRPESNCSGGYRPPASTGFGATQTWNAKHSLGQTRIRFGCDVAILEFDKRNPSQSPRWVSSVSVPKQRQVCTNYVTRNGRQVCESTRTETYDTTESRSGAIQVRRIPES
jgi:hypothetical protein